MERKMVDKNDFLYPRGRYYGQVKPENLVFNANLQEFAQKVSYICNLETAGKVPPEDAYDQIKELWKNLRNSKKQLGIGEHPFDTEQGSSE
jgi:isopropylmalate/homocitrate/citramalate synthase